MSQSDNQTRPDIEQAKNRMTTKFGGKRELWKRQEHIWPGETVERMATGTYGGGLGLLVMTDKRLIFLKEGMLSSTLEDWTCAAPWACTTYRSRFAIGHVKSSGTSRTAIPRLPHESNVFNIPHGRPEGPWTLRHTRLTLPNEWCRDAITGSALRESRTQARSRTDRL